MAFLTPWLCLVVWTCSASCGECCDDDLKCGQAFNGKAGTCCGWDDSLPSCCPAGAYCLDTGTQFQCSYTPPSNNACDACCTRGVCGAAFNGEPAQCCGKSAGTSYCCPVRDASCDARANEWVCKLHKTTGISSEPVVKGVVALGFMYIFANYILPPLIFICILCVFCCVFPSVATSSGRISPPPYRDYGSTHTSKCSAQPSAPYQPPPSYAPTYYEQPPVHVVHHEVSQASAGYSGGTVAMAAGAAGLAGFLGGEYLSQDRGETIIAAATGSEGQPSGFFQPDHSGGDGGGHRGHVAKHHGGGGGGGTFAAGH
eukprot:gb/GEZN01011066.1/.p1 GENE.gb/GEZN01011066.1/~~gb/GEZN01011066.1/.p1  ORF type:complete len:314 (+),score=17.05 gb/GEZN01011066.1/:84-1025(+)